MNQLLTSHTLSPEELLEGFMETCQRYRDQPMDDDDESDGMMCAKSIVNQIFGNYLYRYSKWTFAKAMDELQIEDLSTDAEATFFALCEVFYRQFTQPAKEEDFSGLARVAFITGIRELVDRGLVISVAIHNNEKSMSSTDAYLISKPAARLLFGGIDKLLRPSVLSQFGTFVYREGIEGKTLSFPPELQQSVDKIVTITSTGKYETLVKNLQANGLRDGLTMLFYGPPGTGKTEFARQLAKKTGRDLFIVDSAKLGGTYFGEEPRQIRNLFRAFSYCCAVSIRVPILLFDEADSILCRRMTVVNASDKEANSVANIILEEMNVFSGILIATTNNLQTLDPAMFRRFLIKLEFSAPDTKTRAAIWKTKLPWLSTASALKLAEHGALSGGLIDNVVSLCIIEKSLIGKNPSLSFILHLLEGQEVGADRPRPKIGFQSNVK